MSSTVPAASQHAYETGTRIPAWVILVYVAMVALAILTLIPIVWMILTTFKSEAEIAAQPPTWLPRAWHPENFEKAWTFAPFGRYLLNSIVMVGGITLLQVVTSIFAAYAFARLHFKWRDGLFLGYLGTLMIPPQIIIVPQFILVRSLHLVDTYLGLIIPQAFTAFGVFLLRQFFVNIPKELEDSARIDGCSRLGTLWRIIVPLSGPAIATLIIFTFMFNWNNLLWPLVIANTNKTIPVVVGLLNFQGEHSTDWNLLMAAALITTIPVIIVFVVAQRCFVQGIALSGFGGR